MSGGSDGKGGDRDSNAGDDPKWEKASEGGEDSEDAGSQSGFSSASGDERMFHADASNLRLFEVHSHFRQCLWQKLMHIPLALHAGCTGETDASEGLQVDTRRQRLQKQLIKLLSGPFLLMPIDRMRLHTYFLLTIMLATHVACYVAFNQMVKKEH
jgi:hypothetical protein